MKKYTHAWLAMMAMKRIDKAQIPEKQRDDARALVKWFNDYRDFVISGSWYPDSVFKDMGSSHIVKYYPDPESKNCSFRMMPSTLRLFKEGLKSENYKRPYSIRTGNLCDRCEALAEGLIDSFKILYSEHYGSPITPSCNHIAMRFFILSHYIADAHMPLHCDDRSFKNKNEVHGFIEEQWDDEVRKSYCLDDANNRFFYDPEGYPLKKDVTPLVRYVEEELERRPFLWQWGPTVEKGKDKEKGCRNTWDYMEGITQYSFLFSRSLIPDDRDPATISKATYKATAAYKEHFEEYGKVILADAVESIAKVWLHAWVRFRNWWRDSQLASLRAKVAEAQKLLDAAERTIESWPAESARLETMVAKYSGSASAAKSLAATQEKLAAAKLACIDARNNLEIFRVNLKAAEHACEARTKEYAKYNDIHSTL